MDTAWLAPRLRDHLRRRGVVVHLVAARESGLVVFLEGALQQHDLARTFVLAFCGAAGVRFLRASNAVMFVDLAPSMPTAGLPGLPGLPGASAVVGTDCYGTCSAVA